MATTSPSLFTDHAATADNSCLGVIDLISLVKEKAATIEPWSVADRGPLVERTYELVEWDDDVEVWIIHWPQGGRLQLHDHGGSSGAFWVVGGTLQEGHINGHGRMSHRHVPSGGGEAFGPNYVHDVVNRRRGSATSVHAYSPPMPSMTFYNQISGGRLVADRTEYRASPTWAP